MRIDLLLRLSLLPLGLLVKMYELALEGSRDLYNRLRFRKSTIEKKCCINQASTIAPNCHLLGNVIFLNSSIRSFSYIGNNAIIQNSQIGLYCSIANDVQIGLGRHPTHLFSTSPLFYRKRNTLKIEFVDKNFDFEEYISIEIGNDVWIGARATVMDGVKIGDGAIIAAGAVVTHNVPPYAVVGGVPSKIIRYRFGPEKVAKLLRLRWWLWPLSEISTRMNELEE